MAYGAIGAGDSVSQLIPYSVGKQTLSEIISACPFIAGGFGFKDITDYTNNNKTRNLYDSGLTIYTDEFKKGSGPNDGKGYRATMKYRPRNDNAPSIGDNVDYKSQARKWTYDYFQFDIGKVTFVEKSPGEFEIQKTAADPIVDSAKSIKETGLEWLAQDYIDKAAGITTSNDINTPTAPSTNRILYAGEKTSAATIEPLDKLELTLIDYNLALANFRSSTVPKMAPLNRKDGINWIYLIHPWAGKDLVRTERWIENLRNGQVRGNENPLFTGDFEELGVYRKVLIVQTSLMPTFTNYGDGDVEATRCLFMGSNAMAFASCSDAKIVKESENLDSITYYGLKAMLGFNKIKFHTVGEDMGIIANDMAAASVI